MFMKQLSFQKAQKARIDFVMTAIFEIGTSHAYSEIDGYGNKFDAKNISKFIV